MVASVWSESLPVRSSDLTPHGAVSVPALCVYLQEAAGHHAEELGVSMETLQDDDRAWVLSHLHLALDRVPAGASPVTIETWPSSLEGLYATREFVLSIRGAEVGRATSRWFVIDTERRRPVRPPRSLYGLETPDRPRPLPHDFNDLPAPTRIDHETLRRAHYPDLDLNRHVNSARYLEWALGTPVRATAQLDANPDEHVARHALRHADTDALLAAACTRWRTRS